MREFFKQKIRSVEPGICLTADIRCRKSSDLENSNRFTSFIVKNKSKSIIPTDNMCTAEHYGRPTRMSNVRLVSQNVVLSFLSFFIYPATDIKAYKLNIKVGRTERQQELLL